MLKLKLLESSLKRLCKATMSLMPDSYIHSILPSLRFYLPELAAAYNGTSIQTKRLRVCQTMA